jgi:hypothetical protein
MVSAREYARVKRDKERLERELEKAHAIIDVQKKTLGDTGHRLGRLREEQMTGVQELLPITGVSAACAVLKLPRSTYYRHQRPRSPRYSHPRKPNPRRYSDAERAAMRDVLNSKRFMDMSPEQVSAILLEEGTHAVPRSHRGAASARAA